MNALRLLLDGMAAVGIAIVAFYGGIIVGSSTNDVISVANVITALAGPLTGLFAIGIAIYSNRETERRFQRQIEQDRELDERADGRQQSEWMRQDLGANREKANFRHSVIEGMIRELEVAAKRAETLEGAVKRLTLPGHTRLPVEQRNVRVPRPVFSSLGSNFSKLPPRVIDIVASNEGQYSFAVSRLDACLKGLHDPNRSDPWENRKALALEAAECLIDTCAWYLAYLRRTLEHGPEEEIEADPVEAMKKAGLFPRPNWVQR